MQDVLHDLLVRLQALHGGFSYSLQSGGSADTFYMSLTAQHAPDPRLPAGQESQRKRQKLLDEIARATEGLRRAIAVLLQADPYNTSGIYHDTALVLHAENLASYCEPNVEQLEKSLQRLKNDQLLRPELKVTMDDFEMPKGFRRAYFEKLLGRLEEQLLRPARHINGVIEYPEDDFVDHPGSTVVTAPFFSRYELPRTEQHPPLIGTNISYYRVTRDLC